MSDYPKLIPQHVLEDLLINEDIIQTAAVDDPYDYDGGKTELALSIVTQKLNEIIMKKFIRIIESPCAADESSALIENTAKKGEQK